MTDPTKVRGVLLKSPVCSKCHQKGRLIEGKWGPYYQCPCGSRVSANKSTLQPVGSLADLTTRRARWRAHKALDRLWHDAYLMEPESRQPDDQALFRERGKPYDAAQRVRVYKYFFEVFNKGLRRFHIADLDEDECNAVVSHSMTLSPQQIKDLFPGITAEDASEVFLDYGESSPPSGSYES